MSRILKRPMFRTGGTPNEGIMHGLVNRRGYSNAGSIDPKRTRADVQTELDILSEYAPMPKSRFPMGQIGLNLVSGEYAGDGLLSNIAGSAKGPYSEWTARDDLREQALMQRRAGAAGRSITQQRAEAKLRQEIEGRKELARYKDNPNKALRNVYLQQAIEDGYDAPEAQRIADYQVFTKTELQNKVGRNRIGGIIEFDLNDSKQKKKQLPKMKKDVGKYFYDPYDGKIKLLTDKNGVLGFVEFNSVAEIDSATLAKTEGSTISTTPYADEQKAMEQEKSEGLLTDEDIAGIRFP